MRESMSSSTAPAETCMGPPPKKAWPICSAGGPSPSVDATPGDVSDGENGRSLGLVTSLCGSLLRKAGAPSRCAGVDGCVTGSWPVCGSSSSSSSSSSSRFRAL